MIEEQDIYQYILTCTLAEKQAVERHKYFLSEKAGYDVGLERTVSHWLEFHAKQWRRNRLQADMKDQAREIQKHKWIESEKAGCDLGSKAVYDWIVKYAEEWRRWREENCDATSR